MRWTFRHAEAKYNQTQSRGLALLMNASPYSGCRHTYLKRRIRTLEQMVSDIRGSSRLPASIVGNPAPTLRGVELGPYLRPKYLTAGHRLLGFLIRSEKGRQCCQPPGWNGIPGCPALAGSGVSTSRLMTTGSCPLLTTTASQISFGLPLIS